MTQERKEALELLWQTYPQDKVFFLTSDNQAFRLENDARNHAKSLEDTTVDKCERTPSSAGAKPAKKPNKKKEVAPAEPTPPAEQEAEESEDEDEDEEAEDEGEE